MTTVPDTVRSVPHAFDVTPWTSKVSFVELRAFTRNTDKAQLASTVDVRLGFFWVFAAICWLFVAGGAWAIWQSVKGQSLVGLFVESIWVALAAVGYLILFVGAVAVTWFAAYMTATRQSRRYRAVRFAEINHMRYAAIDESVTARNTVFGLGLDKSRDPNISHPFTRYSYTAENEPGFEIGDYQYATVVDNQRATPNWGYMRVQLPKSYPHIVFQERRGESVPWPQTGWQDLPTPQLLAPELTDFYTLHCPVEYQEHARAIFTAELILALKNRPKGRDSHIEGEILDDQLWIYQYGLPFNLYRAKNIRPAFDILATALKARDVATETQRPDGPRAREA